MGVRLYINTNEVKALEQCAGVKPGTAKRYEQFLIDNQDTDSYELYCMCKDDKDLNDWHDFKLFGFGKFAGPRGSEGGQEKDLKICIQFWLSSAKCKKYADYRIILHHLQRYGVQWC